MRAFITAVGSRGDVQPAFALACALRKRGHEVLVSASADFAQWAGELGLAFVSSGPNLQQWLQENWKDVSGSPRRFLGALRRVGTEMFPLWFDTTLSAAQGADIIISANQFAAPTTAEVLRIPIVGIAYSPTLLRSAHHAPIFVTWQRLPRWLNATLWKLMDHTTWALTKRHINIERARLGLQPVASMTQHMFEGFPYLLAQDSVFAPAPPDWLRFDVTTTGPWFYDDLAPLDAEVQGFLDAGPPPVYVGFGSMASSEAERLTRVLIDGAQGHRLLMSAGWAGIGRGQHPSTVKIVKGPMPHAKLFPKLAAVVHHGGAGTTAAALRAGVPQVVVPHMADQFYNAHRLAALGLAPRGISVKRLTAVNLRDAIQKTLVMPPEQRAKMATRLGSSNGVDQAVEIIEKTARQ